jgi:hypothetical protein
MRTKFKLSLFLFSIFLTQAAMADSDPIRYIQLKGSFYEMGQQYVQEMRDTLVHQLSLIKKELPPADPLLHEQFEKEVHQLIQIAKMRYPAELYAFLQGEADSSFAQAHNITLDDFVFMDNLMFFIKFAQNYKPQNNAHAMSSCSFIGIRDSSVIVGRNYDFPRSYINLMTTHPIIMRLENQDKIHYPNVVTAISFPGGISAATFMNDKGHYISINAGTNAMIDKQFMVFHRQSYVNQMLLAMMKVPDFNALHQWAESTAADYSYIVNMAGPEHEQLLSIETSAYNVLEGEYSPNQIPGYVFKARTRQPQSMEVTMPELDYNVDMLVATNTFHLLHWEPFLGHPIEKIPFSYSEERYQNLVDLGRNRQNSNETEMISIMEKELNTHHFPQGATVNYCGRDTAYENEDSATYYSVVFDTKTRSMAVRFQQNNKEDSVKGCSSLWSNWTYVRE